MIQAIYEQLSLTTICSYSYRLFVQSHNNIYCLYRARPSQAINLMNLLQIKHAIRHLSLGQLKRLDQWLHELIRRAEESDRKEKSSSRKRLGAEQSLNIKTYRLESISCGKENCKCMRGKPMVLTGTVTLE